MSDGRKCFQQLLLQWVEHTQSIAKQIKKWGKIERKAGNLNDKNHSGLHHNHTSQKSSAVANSENTLKIPFQRLVLCKCLEEKKTPSLDDYTCVLVHVLYVYCRFCIFPVVTVIG